MKRGKFTIAVMPSSGRRIRTFSISITSLIFIFVFLTIIITSSLTVGYLKFWKFYRQHKWMAFEATQKYEVLQRELQEIRKSYSDFKSIMGIEMVEPGDETGKGGPEMPELTDYVIEPSSVGGSADASSEELSSILKEAVYLRYSLDNLTRIAGARLAEFTTIPSIWPIKVEPGRQIWMSSRFGPRRSPFTGAWEWHEGVDIRSSKGTPLIATADGIIVSAGSDRYIGNFVEIQHNKRFSTLYGHLDSFAEDAVERSRVKRGQVIGYVGDTGRSTGYHVHYEVRVYGKRVDPMDYILN